MNKMTAEEQKPLRIGAILIAIAILLVIIVVKIDAVGEAAAAVGKALKPFAIGLVIAYMLNVLVSFFEKSLFSHLDHRIRTKRWPGYKRAISVLLSLAVMVALISLIFSVMLPNLSKSISGLFAALQQNGPRYYNEIVDWLENLIEESQLTIDLSLLLDKLSWESIFSKISEFSTDIISSIVNATVNVTSAVFTIIVSVMVSIYFLFGKEKLLLNSKSLIYAFLPIKWSKRITNAASVTNYVFFQFVRGQLMECLILGGLCYLGMTLFRFEYALLVSFIMALTALIPIFGAYAGAIAGAFILLLENPQSVIWFLLFIIILQQLEGNFIYPRVVGHSIGLPAIWTMFAVIFCGSLFGIPGVLLGTPMTAVLYRFIRKFTNDRLDKKGIDIGNLKEDDVKELIKESDSAGS